MTLRIFHTGDVHIGMSFKNYPDDVKNRLISARLDTLEEMITLANDKNADIFVIAGDLFNSINVPKKDIYNVVNIVNKFNKLVLILPGNHDYENGGIELWESFMKDAKDNVVLLDSEEPYLLEDYDLDATIYPAPCRSKHSRDNNLQWIKDIDRLGDSKYKVGIAHGALEGLSADIEGTYFSMSMNELDSIPVDLWLLGHTHVSYPLNDKVNNHKIFNAGTHEPDGLDYRYGGQAWLIEMSEGRTSAEKVTTGQYRFYDKDFQIDIEEDFDKIKTWIMDNNPNNMILRLNLEGSLNKEDYENISNHYREFETMVFHLIIEDRQLRRKIDQETIDNEFVKGSFPNEFLNYLVEDEEALQLAYDLIRRG